eukprot:TRINITY_DN6246_c0_g2_i9.p1 TRINITY_DN6246_c0_g2~~TRINITY_DN6246_c0_g2_i9.p1  ORF type:complete len:233 (-),score=36.25 TRINITY_DN6246_c0_g2_i9:296-994(-)
MNPKEKIVISSGSEVFPSISVKETSNPRTVRALEMLSQKASKNLSISISDIKEMQRDLYDKQAERIFPIMLRLVKKHSDLHHILTILEDWDLNAIGNDKHALIYNLWLDFLFDELLKNHLSEYERELVKLRPNRFLEVMIGKWGEGKELKNGLCGKYENSEDPCVHVLAYSLRKAWKFIVRNIGKNEKNWQWNYVNSQDYYNPVFEGSFLRYLFHIKTYSGVSSCALLLGES